MIISGGSRCNWRWFAKHLTNGKDNDRVAVIEIRGLAGDKVLDAFREMDALASGTRCKNFFYHADINPRADEHLTAEQWERAVDALESNLGLEGHSRFIVEHEKEGRTHRHIIWSRIDVDTMTAVSDSRNYAKHEETARLLEREFDQEAVQSTLGRDSQEKRPKRRAKNWETFRGNKSSVDPEAVKAEVTALWKESDSGAAFKAALTEHGYLLCKGDRRDFCIIDPAGQEHSLARRVDGVKAAEIRARMADIDREKLPTVAQGRAENTSWGKNATTEGHSRVRQAKMLNELLPVIRSIERSGEIKQGGVGNTWWERARGAVEQVRQQALEIARTGLNKWQDFMETRRGQREPKKDKGRELERE